MVDASPVPGGELLHGGADGNEAADAPVVHLPLAPGLPKMSMGVMREEPKMGNQMRRIKIGVMV